MLSSSFGVFFEITQKRHPQLPYNYIYICVHLESGTEREGERERERES